MSPPPSHPEDDALVRRAKKRELDRRAQRAARERTRQRIAHLEGIVQAVSHGPSLELSAIMEQLSTVSKERDDLAKTLSTIQAALKPKKQVIETISGESASNTTSQSVIHQNELGRDGSPGAPNFQMMENPLSNPANLEAPHEPFMAQRLLSGDHNASLDAPSPSMILGEQAVPLLDGSFSEQPLGLMGSLTMPTCDCVPKEPEPGGIQKSSIWRLANEVLGYNEPLSDIMLRSEDELSEDIPVRVLLHGWDAVEKSKGLPVLWKTLRKIDELQFASCGKVERLAILIMMHRLLRCRAEPASEQIAKLPLWYLSRPSQMIPHSSAIDFFVWPGVRERFVFFEHKYCSDTFWQVFTSNFRILWPFEFRDCYRCNIHTGRYDISPEFNERLQDIRSWAMAGDFFTCFPEITADIPNSDDIPWSLYLETATRYIVSSLGHSWNAALPLLSRRHFTPPERSRFEEGRGNMWPARFRDHQPELGEASLEAVTMHRASWKASDIIALSIGSIRPSRTKRYGASRWRDFLRLK